MIKLQMHQTTLEGKPLTGTGKIVSGEDAYEVIEAMKIQSPFTADMTARQYIDNVLSKIMQEGKSTELDATEFLTKLAEQGYISFLPTNEIAGEPPVANCASNSADAAEAKTQEVAPCADKQA